MLSRRVLINLVLFLGVALALIAYGVVDLLGNPLAARTHISTVVPASAGLVPRLTVTSNGIEVGTVTGVKLVRDGVRVEMMLNPGVEVPDNVTAAIVRANPLGEQAVELRPKSAPAPPLRNGAVVPAAHNAVPPDVGKVIRLTDRILAAVPKHDLDVLIHQLALTLNGSASALRTLTNASDQYAREFLAYKAAFKALLANSPPVLRALANTVALTALIDRQRYDIVDLFHNAGHLADVLGPFIHEERPNVACLVHDLADVNANLDQPANLSALQTTLSSAHIFFGAVNASALPGPSKAVEAGTVARDDQVWLRVNLLVPPAFPQGQPYYPHRGVVPTLPGAGCISDFGPGVGPATQAHPTPPAPGGRVIPPTREEALVLGRHLYGSRSGGTQPTAADQPLGSAAMVAVGLLVLAGALAMGLAFPVTRRRRRALLAALVHGAGGTGSLRGRGLGNRRRGADRRDKECDR